MQRAEAFRPPEPGETFRVADWVADPAANRLLRDGEEVHLEPKAMGVLVCLAGHPGQVVSRRELEATVWPRTEVSYDAITNAVIKLRRAFGDDPHAPRVIETISKQGYRLIAEVGPADRPRPPEQAGVSPRSTVLGGVLRAGAGGRRWLLAGGGALTAVVLVAVGLIGMQLGQRPSPTPDGHAPGVEPPSIAVLPFRNLSTDPGQEYFSDGIAEDLITELAKVSGLRVIARSSAFAYKGNDTPERSIGRELGVRYLLRGSVRRDAAQLRLNVRLVDTRDGHTMWAERYDRRLTEIFRIQDALTAEIVAALEVELAPPDLPRLRRGYEASVEAYDALLRGLDYYGRRTREDNQLAKAHYERAITLDPGFARAYAALALAWARDAVDGWESDPERSMAKAEGLVAQALELDPSVPQIYFARGLIALNRGDHGEAIRQAEAAIARKPGYADGFGLLAWALHFAGRPLEGLEAMERAVHLNPRVPSIYRMMRGALYYALGEHGRAIEDLETAVAMSPTFQMPRVWLAAAYAGADRVEEARWQAEEVLALNPDFTPVRLLRSYHIRDPDYRARFLADLGAAGLKQAE
ncbi:MAG: winged helix-turn-helix domain-containing protein [Thiocapsa sp.]|jgi:TolB-like protein/DNA-binding winged helix-turn-helix (wHTH) protein/cytochrome c-type biogenesis protein CcmH/NrfG|nr:winged helix-turn-helix domain-containing protein [Thiocapsa sp.]MCG6897846.1 winged helix-turn-helix domain-containing protein [Thiocapsa sp.]